jgi:hypothetical protein
MFSPDLRQVDEDLGTDFALPPSDIQAGEDWHAPTFAFDPKAPANILPPPSPAAVRFERADSL